MSFLPDVSSFTTLIETSLDVMSHECPEAYQCACQVLDTHEVSLTIDSEIVSVRFYSTYAEMLFIPQQPTAYLMSTKSVLLDLVDANYTLEYAITHDLLHMRGKMDTLIRFYEALQLYIHGAVRCPSFPALLSDYRFRA